VSQLWRTPIDAHELGDALGRLPSDIARYVAAVSDRDRALADFVNEYLNREVYSAQLLTGDLTSAANAETTVVTLGSRLFLGGRIYEIRATVSVKGSTEYDPTVPTAGTRMLARIFNATDTIRSNICDLSPTNAGQFTTYHAIMRFQPPQDAYKEFRVSFQNANAIGTFTVCGTAPGATGAVPALITATQIAAV
jgi:hypothetical protein